MLKFFLVAHLTYENQWVSLRNKIRTFGFLGHPIGEVQVLSMERPILNLEYSRQVTEKNSVSNRDGLTRNIHDICYLRGRKSRLLYILDQETYFSWHQKRVFNLVWVILFLAPEVLLQSLNHQRGGTCPAFCSKTHKAIWLYSVT